MRHWSRRKESASVGSTARHFVGRNETTWSATSPSAFRQRRVSDAGSATRGAARGGSIVSWPPPRINVRIRSMRANACADSAVETAAAMRGSQRLLWVTPSRGMLAAERAKSLRLREVPSVRKLCGRDPTACLILPQRRKKESGNLKSEAGYGDIKTPLPTMSD